LKQYREKKLTVLKRRRDLGHRIYLLLEIEDSKLLEIDLKSRDTLWVS
jgi:hypothetical protein